SALWQLAFMPARADRGPDELHHSDASEGKPTLLNCAPDLFRYPGKFLSQRSSPFPRIPYVTKCPAQWFRRKQMRRRLDGFTDGPPNCLRPPIGFMQWIRVTDRFGVMIPS